MQLWLPLTGSSHALSQGRVCSLSTVREVEISHVDTEEGGPGDQDDLGPESGQLVA